MENIKQIIESLLFVAEEPLTVDKIKRITEQAETKEIKDALAALSAEYDARPGGFYLDEVAGGFQIRTRPEYNEWIRKMIQPRPLRLSKAALETLVIIAYKQPIIRSDVEHLRGVDCGGVLRVLLERKLIRVLGRREIAGRPLIYATTKRFLEVFDLKDLKDLPTPKEIEELGASLTESNEPIALEPTEEIESEPESTDDTDSAMEPAAKEREDTPQNYEAAEAGITSENYHTPKASPAAEELAEVEEAQVIRIPSSAPSEVETTPEGLMPNDPEPPPAEPFTKPKENG